MRLLADENIPGSVVDLLRGHQHDVVWIRTDFPGISDPDILKMAVDSHRVLITFDKDYGELIFRQHRDASCGVVLFRFRVGNPAALPSRLVRLLESRADWVGNYSVVTDRSVRTVPLVPGNEPQE